MRSLALAIGVLLLSTTAWAQNPCTAALPGTAIVSTNSEIVFTLPDQTTTVSGFAVVTEYTFGIFLPGVDPATGGPVTSVTVAKSSWTLKAGTTNCYGAKVPELLAIPINADRRGALKAKRTTPDVAESAWSAPTNPFVLLGAPAVPSGGRVTP